MGLKDYIFAHEPPASVHGHVNARRSSASRTKRLSLASSEETSTTEPSTTEPSLPDFDHSEHEMVVAYIYQQQCSKFWIGNMKSDNEGAFMRVGRGSYVTCPEHLKDSPLAAACEALNVQVCLLLHLRNGVALTLAQTTSCLSTTIDPRRLTPGLRSDWYNRPF